MCGLTLRFAARAVSHAGDCYYRLSPSCFDLVFRWPVLSTFRLSLQKTVVRHAVSGPRILERQKADVRDPRSPTSSRRKASNRADVEQTCAEGRTQAIRPSVSGPESQTQQVLHGIKPVEGTFRSPEKR